MILGLSGTKGSGKDTVAAYLVKEHGFERKAFADPLKRSIAALFNIPFTEVDKLKNMEILVGIGRIGESEYDQWIQYAGYPGLHFREFIQRYGTEAHRDVFGEDFWLDYTLPVQGFYPGRAIVVTDVRFVNEADRVRLLGGYVVLIHRNKTALHSKNQHRSEQFAFAADYEITNDGTLHELYAKIEEIITIAGQNSYA